MIALVGWPVGILAGVIHVLSYLGLSGAVNAVAHTFGRRPYENSATNVGWLTWLTAGEGLHNNHHAAPTSARFALHDGEIDPAWPFIRLLRTLGLADIRRTDPVFTGSRDAPADR